jgi:hypothetical protein
MPAMDSIHRIFAHTCIAARAHHWHSVLIEKKMFNMSAAARQRNPELLQLL